MADDPEKLAKAYFKERYGLDLQKIPKSKRDGVKTPDFNVLADGQRVACMEVKNLTDTMPVSTVEEINALSTMELARASVSSDTMEDTVAQRLYDAANQLANHEAPRIALIVNDRLEADHLDLGSVLWGGLQYESGQKVSQLSRAVRERVGDHLQKLDLCLWLQGYENKLFRFWNTETGRVFDAQFFADEKGAATPT